MGGLVVDTEKSSVLQLPHYGEWVRLDENLNQRPFDLRIHGVHGEWLHRNRIFICNHPEEDMFLIAIDATMAVDFGENSTDIVIMFRNQPRLVRAVPGGFGVLVKAIANGLSVREDQARQFILKFGLDQNQVEGQVFKILGTHLDNFASELTKSVRFFQTKYINGKVGGIVLSGYASMIPLFSEYIEAKTRVSAMKGNPWQFVRTTEDQQRALMSVASEFAVAIGLSERSND
jgi:type IV pilus assembly protein PilM/plasmid segregation protein ParM